MNQAELSEISNKGEQKKKKEKKVGNIFYLTTENQNEMSVLSRIAHSPIKPWKMEL